MPVNNEVLAIILGGGQGTRLFPLTQHRSKPAVPIGGKYRLIDIPISNCLHADIRRIFVLTQFNSASLNRHIAQTYRMDLFSQRLRRDPRRRADARQPELVSGHGRRRAPGGAALRALRRRLLPDSRRRSSLPDGLRRADRRAHRSATPTSRSPRSRSTADDATAMGIFRFDRERPDRRVRGEADAPSGSPRSARASRRRDVHAATPPDKPFIASMGIYVFSRDVLLDVLERDDAASTSAARSSRRRSTRYRVQRVPVPRLLGRRRHGRVVLRRQHHADAPRRAVQLLRSAPADLHAPALPARVARCSDCTVRDAIIAEGCYLDRCDDRASRSSASARTIQRGRRRSRARCCSAPTSTRPTMTRRPRATAPRLGIGRDVVLDRVIVDKNARIGDGARLVNEARRRRTPTATATTSATASSSCRRTASSSRDSGLRGWAKQFRADPGEAPG